MARMFRWLASVRAATPVARRARAPVALVVTGLAACLAAVLVASCAHRPVPASPALSDAERRVPVVLVPGITGTRLRDPASGRLAWGNGRALFAPRDRGYELALPVTGRPRAGGPLEVGGVIRRIRIGPLVKPIYQPIVDLLERHGYRLGRLEQPDPAADLFLFGYDWRQENALSAGRLAAQLDGLRRARGAQRMPVTLICQSNGAHICRWLAKYGGASLEQAEGGGAAPPPGLELRQLILVSTANGGSLRNLEWLLRGRRYVPGVGRFWSPELVFTLRSVFEDLPVFRSDLFLDAGGEPLAVDLFDVASWRSYGWSIFDPVLRRRLERGGRRDLFGSHEDRVRRLAEALDRAGRFHRQLRRDTPGVAPPRLYLVQNGAAATPVRAVLEPRRVGWRTRFAGDRWLRRHPWLARRLHAPGDGHAAVASQLWLSPAETASLAGAPVQVDGGHFELILSPVAQRALLAILGEG